ncbi:hypothetical protein CEP54_001988 [Fusarium duplospermum]|uniref:Uncharacterized protein n=1 Tax=Fusarium duplospermum TaxID=1325734 RepID=A0A428QXF6_9HYPO|nr:hypothetical protein CEP54_001988 [Fusarium duplospermum]
MAPNPPSTNTDCVNGKDMIPSERDSVLLRYLHDNTSFSDRLVELTVVDSTTESQATVPDHANVNTGQQKKDHDKAPDT